MRFDIDINDIDRHGRIIIRLALVPAAKALRIGSRVVFKDGEDEYHGFVEDITKDRRYGKLYHCRIDGSKEDGEFEWWSNHDGLDAS